MGMMASTAFFFLRMPSFHEKYKTALAITGLVTFIAMYHYCRIFNSFEAAYTPCFKDAETGEVNYNLCNADEYGHSPTGIPFNDAYRYIDWLLTVPMLLTEIILLHRVHSLRRTQGGSRGSATRGQGPRQDGMLRHCYLLVHLPCRLHPPYDDGLCRRQGWSHCPSNHCSPNWIHRLGHHL